MPKPVSPCARCLNAAGATDAAGVVRRYGGAAFGFSGPICQKCYNHLRHRRITDARARLRVASPPSPDVIEPEGDLELSDAEQRRIDREIAALHAARTRGEFPDEVRNEPNLMPATVWREYEPRVYRMGT